MKGTGGCNLETCLLVPNSCSFGVPNSTLYKQITGHKYKGDTKLKSTDRLQAVPECLYTAFGLFRAHDVLRLLQVHNYFQRK